MQPQVIIRNKNEVHVTIECSDSISYELKEYFSFFIPNHHFNPKVKAKLWNGRIYLFSIHKKEIYRGLVQEVIKFCEDNDYTYEYEDEFKDEFSVKEAQDFIASLKLPSQYEIRDYQLDAFVHSIRNKRALILSPTGSGKSLNIYLTIRKILQNSDSKILIIVPTINLVNQLASDFEDYGWNADKYVHRIHGGMEQDTDKPVVISTWQSLITFSKNYFKDFDAVIIDEAHTAQAKSITNICTALVNAKYRIGTTGTIDDTQAHKWVIEGLTGPYKRVTTTKALIDNKTLSEFEIKCLLLKHPLEDCKPRTYPEEIEFLVLNESRNKFIANLALSLEGNTLLLFQYIKHGKLLLELLKNKGKPVYFVYGKTEAEIREQTRNIVETETNSIIIASVGVFAVGVNIKNLHNVIFSSPSKARIRILQSIGRVLRRSDTKTKSILFDIADNLIYKKKENFTFKHFTKRLQYYAEEKFSFKIYKLNLKGK